LDDDNVVFSEGNGKKSTSNKSIASSLLLDLHDNLDCADFQYFTPICMFKEEEGDYFTTSTGLSTDVSKAVIRQGKDDVVVDDEIISPTACSPSPYLSFLLTVPYFHFFNTYIKSVSSPSYSFREQSPSLISKINIDSPSCTPQSSTRFVCSMFFFFSSFFLIYYSFYKLG
jgi:hypothetical protein